MIWTRSLIFVDPHSLFLSLPVADADVLIPLMDKDKDGKITFDEFREFMKEREKVRHDSSRLTKFS